MNIFIITHGSLFLNKQEEIEAKRNQTERFYYLQNPGFFSTKTKLHTFSLYPNKSVLLRGMGH